MTDVKVSINGRLNVPDDEWNDFKAHNLTYGNALKYACRVFSADVKSRTSLYGKIAFTSEAGKVVFSHVRFGYDVYLEEKLLCKPVSPFIYQENEV